MKEINNIGDIDDQQIEYTDYDRLLRAWENSMEMVRDFEMYSKRVDDERIREIFKKFAEDEGKHASILRKMLIEYKNKK